MILESGYTPNFPEYIVLHHSYNPEDNIQFEEWDNMRNYHINTNGWLDVGYHYGIEYVSGEVVVQRGRDESVNGAHCQGLNTKSIGICLIGNYDNKLPDDKMIDKLIELIQDIYTRYGVLPIVPHSDYADKTCPGSMFPIDEVRRMVSEHWAQEYYDRLQEFGLDLTDTRFDDNITRGEAFALIDKALSALVKNFDASIGGDVYE